MKALRYAAGLAFVVLAAGVAGAARFRASATQPAQIPAPASGSTAAPSSQPAQGTLPWLTRFADALDESGLSRKPILVDVGAEWCAWCRELDAQLQTPDVQQRLKGFTRLRLDADRDADSVRTLAVGPLPALRVLAANGKMIAWHNGYMDAKELSAWLDAHAGAGALPPLAELDAGGAPDASAVDKIVAQLTDRDPVVHEAAVRRLLDYPDAAAAKVVDAFAAGSLPRRVAARELLEAWKAPVAALDPWNPQTITPAALDALRSWAAKKHEPPTLASLSPADLEIARHDIAAMLRTNDPAEVESARERLARFGPALLPEVYADLKAAVTDQDRERLTALRYRAVATESMALHWPGGFDALAATDPQKRHKALDALAAHVTPADSPLLMELFGDRDPLVRETSLKLLQSMGGGTSGGFARLLHDPEPNVRAAVLKQLAETPDPNMAGEIVKYVATEKDPDLVVHAIRFLRQLDSRPAVDCLEALLSHESWRVRAEAAEGLGAVLQHANRGSGAAAETQADIYSAMIKLLEDPDGFVVSRAMGVLKNVRLPSVTKAIAALGDRRPEMAAEVVKALGTRYDEPDPFVLQTLRKYLKNKDAAVRSAALSALGVHATTEDLLPVLADSSAAVRVTAAQVVEQLLEQQRPGNNGTTSGTVDWDQWLADYRAAKERASWTNQMIEPLGRMLRAKDDTERLAAAVPLVALGDDHEAYDFLFDVARRSPHTRAQVAQALQWLPWDARSRLFDALRTAASDDARLVGMLAGRLAAAPTPKAIPALWDLLKDPSVSLSVVSEIERAMIACTGSEYWDWRPDSADDEATRDLLATSRKMVAEGTANQRLVALVILLTAAPPDAATAAQTLVENVDMGEGLRSAALQVQLLAQTRADGVKAALARMGDPGPLRKVAIAYLAAGGEPLRMIQGEIYLTFNNPQIAFREFGQGSEVVINPPPGLTAEMLQPVLKDADPECAAYAGYLLCLLGDRQGLDPLVRCWQERREDPVWRRLVYRAVTVVNDDALTPVLEQVYASYDKDNPYTIRDFYWTIHGIKGDQVLKLRKKIRDEIGMERLR